SSRRRHTRFSRDWSSDVCSSDLRRLEVDVDSPVDTGILEGDDVGFVEAVLAPRSGLTGKTLRKASFQTRFGMHVVAIVREGETRSEERRVGKSVDAGGGRRIKER